MILSAYIWTKQVEGATLTYDCTDKTDPVQFPGWRGVLDFAKLGLTVNGTTHNTAIKGLFEYIDPNGYNCCSIGTGRVCEDRLG